MGQAFSPGPDVDEVSLVLSPGARWVTETYPTREVRELAGGRVRVVLAVGGLAWLERLLLRLGPEAEAVDPPHLEVARRLLELFALDEVLFIPACVAPHKRRTSVTPALHRYAMLALATQDDERLRVSTIELDAPESDREASTTAKTRP